ncbi:O-antigen ligase family protein [Hydrocarboniphaga effusa]|uniref:O-antigen ligase family protein n=1 Tax=Hydrocarboniphaga effusa TaxID=243629 RepID=UPI00398BEB35
MKSFAGPSSMRDDVAILSIALLPLWWIAGVDFIIYHLVALWLIYKAPIVLKPRDALHFSLLLLIFALTVSLIISVFGGDTDSFRMIAALNNVSIIGVGYVYYGHIRKRLDVDGNYVKLIWKAGFIIACMFIVVALSLSTTVMRGGAPEISVPTLFGLAVPKLPGLLGTYQRAYFVSADWFGGDNTPRLFIFAPFATGSAVVAAITGYMGYAHLQTKRAWARLLFLGLIFLAVALTLTRGAIAALVLGFAFLAFLRIGKLALLLLIVALPFLIVLSIAVLPSYFDQVLEMREGSSNLRLLIYRMSFEMVVDNNPLFGLGVKPREDSLGIPIGSHSTFLSVLVRGGFVSFFIAISAFVIVPLKRLLGFSVLRGVKKTYDQRIVAGTIMGGYISCLAFLILQDVDAYASIGVLIMVFLSVIMALSAPNARLRSYHV